MLRDAARGKGGRALDRGSRRLIAVGITVAIALAGVLARRLRHDSALWLPAADTDALLAVGLAIMWAGIALRVWSVATLGPAFRLTVEIDPDQQLVDRGPYRRLRHPSYTGLVLITCGYGVAARVWPALAVAVVLPVAVLARRIEIEERELVVAMGDSYREYQRRTKRLVPGVW